MLNQVTSLIGRGIEGTDGEVGRLVDLYFDDERWGVRHLVVRSGGWLNGRKVLLSPASLSAAPDGDGPLHVALTRQQVRTAPSWDEDKPVSRLYEAAHAEYYRVPYYWSGPYLWGGAMVPGVLPLGATAQQALEDSDARRQTLEAAAHASHLRSCEEVRGYHVHASGGEAGKVHDFLLEVPAWALKQLVVDTRTWWPGGELVVPISAVQAIDWDGRVVRVAMSREALRSQLKAE